MVVQPWRKWPGISWVIWSTVLFIDVDNVVTGADQPGQFAAVFIYAARRGGWLAGVWFCRDFLGPTRLAVGYSLLSEWTAGGDEIALPSDRASNPN
jgi:hypothetical protein